MFLHKEDIYSLVNFVTKNIDKVSAIEYNIIMNQRVVKFVQTSDNNCPLLNWLDSLDKVTKSRIHSKLTRLLENNFGDYKKNRQ